jgi:hypothetical protein
LSNDRGFERRLKTLKRRAAAYRGQGNESAAEEVEDEIRLLELLPQDSPIVAGLAEAALELEENLAELEHEARRKR